MNHQIEYKLHTEIATHKLVVEFDAQGHNDDIYIGDIKVLLDETLYHGDEDRTRDWKYRVAGRLNQDRYDEVYQACYNHYVGA